MTWRMLALFALTCTPFRAQFADLATTDDGAQLYFSSPLRLRGTKDSFYPKIYRYVDGFELFRKEDRVSPDPSPYLTSYFQLIAPQITGDGTVVAYTAGALCPMHTSGCIGQPLDEGIIVGPPISPPTFLDGVIRLSGDKRYALMIQSSINNPYPRLIDLATGALTVLSNFAWIGDGRQAFADNGSILLETFAVNSQTVLWNPVSPVVLKISGTPLLARVSRNGSKVVYESATPEGP
jgi:hypothetical protein